MGGEVGRRRQGGLACDPGHLGGEPQAPAIKAQRAIDVAVDHRRLGAIPIGRVLHAMGDIDPARLTQAQRREGLVGGVAVAQHVIVAHLVHRGEGHQVGLRPGPGGHEAAQHAVAAAGIGEVGRAGGPAMSAVVGHQAQAPMVGHEAAADGHEGPQGHPTRGRAQKLFVAGAIGEIVDGHARIGAAPHVDDVELQVGSDVQPPRHSARICM